MAQPRILAAALAAVAVAPLTAPLPAADFDPVVQRDQQSRVRAEVDQAVRRVRTTLRVLEYQNLAKPDEEGVLRDVAAGLSALRDDQIRDVLAHLDRAARAPDDFAATEQQKAAYLKHREIVSALKTMLARLDTLHSLDQAADGFDLAAEKEHALRLTCVRAERFPESRPRPGKNRVVEAHVELADAQADVRTEIEILAEQLDGLKAKLTEEQTARLTQAVAISRATRVAADLREIDRHLRSANYRPAAERQANAAAAMQEIAAALRTPRDQVIALREARDKVNKLIETEAAIRTATETAATKEPQGPDTKADEAEAKAEGHLTADRQSQLEFETREARRAVEGVSREAADKLIPAEADMRRAEDRLRDGKPNEAIDPEANAERRLAEARDALDAELAVAVAEQSDPLAAVQKAADAIDRTLQKQAEAKKRTEENQSRPDRLDPAADLQTDVAADVDRLKGLPLPENLAVKHALDKADEAATAAAEDLAAKNADRAIPRQDDALAALKFAKKALEDQAEAIQQRRDDIAKLEAAETKLGELAQAEKDLAEAADKAGKPVATNPDAAEPDAAALAEQQGELTPPTRDVGQALNEAAPDAAAKVNEAVKAQDAARSDLDADRPAPAAEQAADAAKKLAAAKAEVAKTLEALKAREIADQAALDPDAADPSQAARQIAKAIEQAEQAARQADQAAVMLGDPMGDAGDEPPMAGDPTAALDETSRLAELQKEVAERAQAMKAAAAAEAAAEAAKALERGDLAAAVREQQKAFGELQKQASGKGDPAGRPPESALPSSATSGQGSPMPGQSGPPTPGPSDPAQAETPTQLAEVQSALQGATGTLAEAAESNAAARAALAQAQALAPQAVRADLDAASQDLDRAAQQLSQARPTSAGQSQQQAAQQLTQALAALNAAAEAMGQPTAQPGEAQQATAAPPSPPSPGPPGQQPGESPGQQAGEKGDGPERNDGRGSGDRDGISPPGTAAVRGNEVEGGGAFIDLQKLERDRVRQNAETAFPARFREQIKQYNINIKDKPAPQSPAAGGR